VRQGIDPFTVAGSIRGAFGLSQFLPSSFLAFAVDGNADGRIDLDDPEDAIPSIANFLRKSGWDKDSSSHYRAVMAYNHSRLYADTVLSYALRLHELLKV
jgi:membrane-bound lytic murein transglycosylase B